MPVRHLDAVFRPAAIALVMPDRDRGGIAAVLARNLIGGGFNGPVLPVSTTTRAVEGVLAYPSLAALPLVPDLCVLAAAADALPGLVADVAARGIRAVLAVSAGLPEHGGPAVEALRLTLGREARRCGLRLLGPDSLGLQVPALGLNASLAPVMALPGHLALLSQSGAVANTVLDWAEGNGVGFSAVVSTGAMAEVDFADCLDHFSRDPTSRAILLYLEEITDARRFLSAARAAARLKPVIVLRAGRHDAADAVYDAAFRRAGMLRVQDLDGLFAAAETIALAKPTVGARLAVVTNGGGIGAMAADALAAAGGEAAALGDETLAALSRLLPAGVTPENPVDLGADAGGARYVAALRALMRDRGNDAVLLLHGPSAFADADATARAVAEAVHDMPGHKPLLTCWLGGPGRAPARSRLAEAGLPGYDTPEDAVTAFLHLVRYRHAQEALAQTPASLPEAFVSDPQAARRVIAAALAEGRGQLHPRETDAVLAAFALAEAPAGPGLPLMVRLEDEPRFGPVLHLEVGGRPPVVAFPPLNLLLAADALQRIGRPSAVVAAKPAEPAPGEGPAIRTAPTWSESALVLVKLSHIAVSLGEVTALRATLRGGRLQGITITVQPYDGDPARRLAIRPYPKQLEQPLTLPDGRRFLIRPVLPEDEPALHALFARLSPDEVRLRFFAPKRALGHAMAARLTQLDYDREMAFVVTTPEPPGQARMAGMVHLIGDTDGERGEFAIMIEHGMTGLGFGPLLMRRILDHARANGYHQVFGEVLRENLPMLKLCTLFGFQQTPDADDPGAMHVRLDLGQGPQRTASPGWPLP